jgi:hypothetical protein
MILMKRMKQRTMNKNDWFPTSRQIKEYTIPEVYEKYGNKVLILIAVYLNIEILFD